MINEFDEIYERCITCCLEIGVISSAPYRPRRCRMCADRNTNVYLAAFPIPHTEWHPPPRNR